MNRDYWAKTEHEYGHSIMEAIKLSVHLDLEFFKAQYISAQRAGIVI